MEVYKPEDEVNVNCSFCNKQIPCPKDMLSYEKHVCDECFEKQPLSFLHIFKPEVFRYSQSKVASNDNIKRNKEKDRFGIEDNKVLKHFPGKKVKSDNSQTDTRSRDQKSFTEFSLKLNSHDAF